MLVSKSVPSKFKTLSQHSPLINVKRNRGNHKTVRLHKDSPINPNAPYVQIKKEEFDVISSAIFNQFTKIYQQTDSDLLKPYVSTDLLENLFNNPRFNYEEFKKMVKNISRVTKNKNSYIVKFKFNIKNDNGGIVRTYSEYAITLPSSIHSSFTDDAPSIGGKMQMKRSRTKRSRTKRSR